MRYGKSGHTKRPGARAAGIAAAVSAGMLLALPALAQTPDIGMAYVQAIGLPGGDVRDIVTSVVRAVLGFTGFVLVVQIIFGGFKWMVAGGSDTAQEEAKAMLKNAVVGFIIVMSASSIADFIVRAVVNATVSYF